MSGVAVLTLMQDLSSYVYSAVHEVASKPIFVFNVIFMDIATYTILVHVIGQNDHLRLLINLILIALSHMTVT